MKTDDKKTSKMPPKRIVTDKKTAEIEAEVLVAIALALSREGCNFHDENPTFTFKHTRDFTAWGLKTHLMRGLPDRY